MAHHCVLRRLRAGFLLIELVVVVAILGIRAGLILPKLDLFKLKANKGIACANMAGVTRYVEGYRISKDVFPNFWDSMMDSGTRTQLYSHLHPNLLGPVLWASPDRHRSSCLRRSLPISSCVR